jgi:hypothetical protein
VVVATGLVQKRVCQHRALPLNDLMLDDSIYACGLAAAQCGEALPHRCISKIDWRLRLRFMRHSLKKKKWSVGKAEPFRTVRRQSRVPRHLIGSGKQA